MKSISLKLKLITFLIVLAITFGMLPASPVVAAASNNISFEDFKSALITTDSSKLVGVFVEEVMAVRVVQQPTASYVSPLSRTVTQFGLASQYGSIGLLAHNYLSGSNFSKLQTGAEIMLVYGDGSAKKFKVAAIKKYQALSPNDPYSNFVNLDNPDKTLSSTTLFKEIYGSSGNLVLQTCISKDGNASWGRLFIIAAPAE